MSGTSDYPLAAKLREILERVPLFELLADPELRNVCDSALIEHFQPGAAIVEAEDPGDSMMIILEGQVKVVLNSPDGREIIISHMKAGDFFGEMSIIDAAPRSAGVKAVENTTVAVLRRSAFTELAGANPNVLLKMAATLCKRLRRADEKIADLAFRDVTGRLAKYLIQLAETAGVKEQGDMFRVKLPSHKDIADLLGTTRETVSRAFSHLRNGEYILGQDRCWLVKQDKLKRLI